MRWWLFTFLCLCASMQAHPIIILLSHPRACSTAFERVMRERQDLTVLHEPFTYLYYLEHFPDAEETTSFPEFFPANYEALRDWLLDLAEQQPVFVKDMAFAALPYLRADPVFTSQSEVQFMVLTRHPQRSLPSLFRIDPTCNENFMGYEALYDAVMTLPVCFGLDADTFTSQPQESYQAFCTAFSLDYLPEALHFTLPPPKDWEGDWYTTVRDSETIEKIESKYPLDDEGIPLFCGATDELYIYWRAMYRRQLLHYQDIRKQISERYSF